MSEMNDLENRLRSWAPRTPSPEIRSALFELPLPSVAGTTPAANPDRFNPPAGRHLTWQWLAPALALLVITASLPHHTFPHTGGIDARSALQNPQLAAYCDAERHSGRNVWRMATFKQTNVARPWSKTALERVIWSTNFLIR